MEKDGKKSTLSQINIYIKSLLALQQFFGRKMAKPVPRVKDANVKCVLLLPCDNCDDCLSRCLAYICSTCPSGEYFQETAFAWVFLWREEKVTKIDRRREREREPQ